MNLVDVIQSVLDDEVIGRLASTLGETAADTRQSLVAGAVPAVLNGLAQRYGSAGGGAALTRLLIAGAYDGSLLTNLANAFGGGAYTDVLLNVGKGLSASLLADRADSVVELIANTTAVRRSSASSLLGLAAPLTLAVIGRQRIQQGLDGNGVQALLGALNPQLAAIAMPGLTTALGVTELGVVSAPEPWSRSLAPWIIVPAALLLAAWALRGCQQHALHAPAPAALHTPPAAAVSRAPQAAVAPAVTAVAAPTATTPAPTATTPAPMATTPAATVLAPAATAAVAAPPPLAEITARVARDSVAYELALFLADPSSAAPRSFVLRDLNFDFNTAEITRSSRKALVDVATVLKSYGRTRVMLQGHTDNSGDASANYDLSLARARAARAALVELGVEAARLSTAGFGADRPLETNETAAGRARNRRTELLVTVK